MPVFSLDNGRLTPARPSLTESEEIVRETLMAVRDQVVELIYQPIFPVAWLTETNRHTKPGRHTSLVALDPSGKTVTVDVVESLDTSILMGSLARASRHEEIPRGRLSGLYPRGVVAFRRDWQEFLDSCPSGLEEHPRLIILAVHVDDEVRAALDSLVGASIEVHRIDLHESRTGLLVSLEQVRPHEASFLAIGRAVRRGEIAPPSAQSPDQPPALESGEMGTDTALPAADLGDGTVEETLADDQGLQVTETDTTGHSDDEKDTTEEPGGVVFIQRKATQEAGTAHVTTGGKADLTTGDKTEPDDVQPAPIERVPAESMSADNVGADSASAVENAGSADQDHATELDDSDEEIFTQVGFTADGAGVAAQADPNLVESEETTIDQDSIQWPERVTELQNIASRYGELTLVFKSLRRRVNATAELTMTGEIVLEDGRRFTEPDEAATVVAGRRMDGWKNWKTSDGTRLSDLRS